MRGLLLLSAVCLCFSVIPLSGGAEGRNDVTGMAVRVVLFPVKRAVLSGRVDSFVKDYRFREGESFREGELIANLEDQIYRQMYLRAEASYKESESKLKFALSNLERNEDLFKKGIAGHKELETSKLEKESTEAQLQFAKANMEMAKLNLDACQLHAPFNGRLSKKLVEDYEYVRAGQPMMEIIDDNMLLAVMYLPSLMKEKIHKDLDLAFKIDETGTVHHGRVYMLSGEIDPRSRTFEVKALIGNKDKKLAPGMSGILVEK